MAGAFDYAIPEADRWGNKNSRTKADVEFDKLDAAGVRSVVLRAMASEEEITKAEQFQKDVQTFLVMNPSYLNSDANMMRMRAHWEEALGVTIPSLEQIEDSYHTLRNHGVITLNKTAVAKENEREVLSRAAELREKREAAEFNEADAYTMPMDQLEAKIRGW
jgi:hypothetical protein